MNVMKSEMVVCFIVSEYSKSLVGVQLMHSNSFSTIVKDKPIVSFVVIKSYERPFWCLSPVSKFDILALKT